MAKHDVLDPVPPAPVAAPKAVLIAPIGAGRWRARARRAAAMMLGLGAGVVVLVVLVWVATDVGPMEGLRTLVRTSLGGVDPVAETLARAVPLVLVAVGAALALRAGVVNVGGEGQMVMGAVAATLAIRLVRSAPPALAWPFGLVAAAVGGALWAVLPAVLWAKRGVSEILSTLLMNFVTVSLLTWLLTETFLHDPDPYVITAQGEAISDDLRLPELIGGTRLHIGALVALIAVVAATWWLRAGGRLRTDVIGANPALADQAGLHARRARVRLLLVSAGFAGLAGGVQLFGLSHRLTTGLTGGVGYIGVLVAILGRRHPVGAAMAAIGYAALLTGGEGLERAGAPRTVADAAIAVMVVAVALATRRRPVTVDQ